MSAPRIMTVALSFLTLASLACNPFHSDPAVEVTTQDPSLNSRWHANLASPASLAGAVQMNGSASMAPLPDGSTNITINLANATPGGVHPWSAHYGQCGVGKDNGVFGSGETYKALNIDSDGHGNATTTVAMQTPKTGDYFVVIKASLANPETVVACGNLAPPTQ